jgi:hypothetical protein
MRNDLQNALLEDKLDFQKASKVIPAPSNLMPLLPSSIMKPAENLHNQHVERKRTEGIKLMNCRAWLRSNNKVWIQSNGFAL